MWIEVIFSQKKNIICGVAYRQHNNPECFSKYIDDKLESFSSKGNPVFLLPDTNIDLLQVNTCNYAHNFLLSLQSNSILPIIDKPTRVHRESAMLIDNIFTNSLDNLVLSGNIITDLSDHFSQFCIMNSTTLTNRVYNFKVRDYSQFSETSFINDVQQIDWTTLLSSSEDDSSKQFSTFYNKLNKLAYKHAPLKNLSKRKTKAFAKPWITKGIKMAVRKKNALFKSNNFNKYKLYRNSIVTLTRASKKLYYQSYFNQNVSNMKKTKTWEGIRELIGHQKKSCKSINVLRDNRTSPIVYKPDKIANIMNSYFALCGHRLAAKLPYSEKHYSDYLTNRNVSGSFAFHLVESDEMITEIMALPSTNLMVCIHAHPNSSNAQDIYCAYLWPRFLITLSNEGFIQKSLKLQKLSRYLSQMMKLIQTTIVRYLCCLSLLEYLKSLCINNFLHI